MKSSLLAIGRQTLGYRIQLLIPLVMFISVIVTIGTAIADEAGAGQVVRKQGKALRVIIRQVTAVQIEPTSVTVAPHPRIEGDRPSCATNTAIFAINPATAGGRAAVALLLSAASEGTTVGLWGTGACNNAVKSDAEELEAIVLRYGE